MYDLMVIGSGPGGYEAAAHAGGMGKKVVLFEMGSIGGTCLNTGCIPTKTMLKSAHLYHEAKEGGGLGIKASGIEFDMKALAARRSKVVSDLRSGVEGMLKRAKVEVVNAKATILEKGKIKANGEVYEGANILIATGGKPATPPIPGADSANVIDSTGILELDTIPASLVVIGGGVIGLEFASFFNTVGAEVTVIEMLPKIGGAIDGEMAKRLMQDMKKQGVNFCMESSVSKISDDMVTYVDKEGAEKTVSGEKILMSTGRVPVLEGLGLDQAGVVYSRTGIKCDDFGQTNVAGIWACGDVTGRCLLAHAASREGFVAVNNMFGVDDIMRYSAVPGVVYTAPEVAGVGYTEEQLKEKGIAYKKSAVPMAVAGRFTVDYPNESGQVKVLIGEEYGQILGVHMIGGPCGEIIHSAVMMVENEMTIDSIKSTIFPHPTISEALMIAIAHA